MIEMKILFLISFFALFTVLLSLKQEPKLIFVELLVRHGQKYPQISPSQQINGYYIKMKTPISQLTRYGKQMQYQMGKKIQKTYWQKLFRGFSNQRPLKQMIYVKSTNVSRTIESAQAHLFGLLQNLEPLTLSDEQAEMVKPPYPGIEAKAGPVFGPKGIAYHPFPVDIGETCFFSSYLNRKRVTGANFATPFFKKMEQYPPFRAAVDEFQRYLNLTKGFINSTNYHLLYMNELCEMLSGKTSSILSHPSQTRRALDAFHTISLIVKFFRNQEQQKVDASPWIAQLISKIKEYLSNPKSPRLIVYSGHQVPMGMMFSALKMWSAECVFENYQKNISTPESCVEFPPFNTVAAFEFYQYTNGTITFKINYNDISPQIGRFGKKKECTLQQLQSWFNSWKAPSQHMGCLGTEDYILQQMSLSNKKSTGQALQN